MGCFKMMSRWQPSWPLLGGLGTHLPAVCYEGRISRSSAGASIIPLVEAELGSWAQVWRDGLDKGNSLCGWCSPHQSHAGRQQWAGTYKTPEKYPADTSAMRDRRDGIKVLGGEEALQMSELPRGSDLILQLAFQQ